MEKKIKKLYRAEDVLNYEDLLAAIINSNFSVDILTDREDLSIVLTFDEESADTAISKMEDIVEVMKVNIEDVNDTFIFSDDYEADMETASRRIRELERERDKACAMKDRASRRFFDLIRKYQNMKSAVTAISTLLRTYEM